MKLSDYKNLINNIINNKDGVEDYLVNLTSIEYDDATSVPIFYFDMDGVLAEFQRTFHKDFVDETTGTVIAKKGDVVLDEHWQNPKYHYYRSLPPTELCGIVDNLCKKGYSDNVYILTKSTYDAVRDKYLWVKDNLPHFNLDNMIFVPYSKNNVEKAEFVPYINKDAYLFDDFSPNLEYWNGKGGKSVNVLNGLNHKDRRFANIEIVGLGVLPLEETLTSELRCKISAYEIDKDTFDR